MSILVDRKTRLLVQGITGTEGRFQSAQMIDYGTRVVAGVTPGRGGQTALDRPIYDTVREAVAETGANASCLFVPARHAADAALEAIEAGIRLLVIVTEGMPTLQTIRIYWEARHAGVCIIGPNSPGVISPGKSSVGVMPMNIHRPGRIGVMTRSSTLAYEVVNELTRHGYGQSTVVGLGGDPVLGMDFVDALELFERDEQTEAVVLIGEIGGAAEQEAAEHIKTHVKKPVVTMVAGRTMPSGRTISHAGAIVGGAQSTAADKISTFQAEGVPVALDPMRICELLAEAGIQPRDSE